MRRKCRTVWEYVPCKHPHPPTHAHTHTHPRAHTHTTTHRHKKPWSQPLMTSPASIVNLNCAYSRISVSEDSVYLYLVRATSHPVKLLLSRPPPSHPEREREREREKERKRERGGEGGREGGRERESGREGGREGESERGRENDSGKYDRIVRFMRARARTHARARAHLHTHRDLISRVKHGAILQPPLITDN